MIPGETARNDFFKDRKLDKVERANNVVPHLSDKIVSINKNITCKEELLSEVVTFPKGKHDDFVDTMIYALKKVYGRKLSILDAL